MNRPPSLWSLQWSSSGELAPLDRQDLFLFLCVPGAMPAASRSPSMIPLAVPRPTPSSS
jgi:hypothetical protein